MNNEEQLGALTNQPVTITLGGKAYTADRLSLYHVALLNRFRGEREKKGDIINLDLDGLLFLFAELIKPHQADVTAKSLARSIPLTDLSGKNVMEEFMPALEAVGFTKPQETKTPPSPTGA